MKMQMTHIGVGIAALAALAAEGKDFSREELNAMLDKLAASPEPKVRRGPQATCYKMAMPQPERFEYVCKKCGTHTAYRKNTKRMADVLARRRDEAASLRALGLGIELDESALCQKCKSEKELGVPNDLGMPTAGTVVGKLEHPSFQVDEKWMKENGLAVGDKVKILSETFPGERGSYLVWPEAKNCWISAKYISESGEILGDRVNIRVSPRIGADVVCRVGKSGKLLRRLPALAGDPEDWVRVETQMEWFEKGVDSGFFGGFALPKKLVGSRSYDGGPSANPARIDKLAWVVDGRRTVVGHDDAAILKAFLTGKATWEWGMGDKSSVKSQLPRLRMLLGEPKK